MKKIRLPQWVKTDVIGILCAKHAANRENGTTNFYLVGPKG